MLDYLKSGFVALSRFNAFKAGQAVTNTVLDKLSSSTGFQKSLPFLKGVFILVMVSQTFHG